MGNGGCRSKCCTGVGTGEEVPESHETESEVIATATATATALSNDHPIVVARGDIETRSRRRSNTVASKNSTP